MTSAKDKPSILSTVAFSLIAVWAGKHGFKGVVALIDRLIGGSHSDPLAESDPEDELLATDDEQPDPSRRRRRSRIVKAVAAILLVSLVGAAIGTAVLVYVLNLVAHMPLAVVSGLIGGQILASTLCGVLSRHTSMTAPMTFALAFTTNALIFGIITTHYNGGHSLRLLGLDYNLLLLYVSLFLWAMAVLYVLWRRRHIKLVTALPLACALLLLTFPASLALYYGLFWHDPIDAIQALVANAQAMRA
jgi:hypothetical protein